MRLNDLRKEGGQVLCEGAALMLDAADLTVADFYSFPLLNVMERNPALLLGGYHADMIVAGVYLALKAEGEDGDPANPPFTEYALVDRICEVLNVAYDGLV